MLPEEFKKKTEEILQNLTDQAKVTDILTELVETYNTQIAEKTEKEEKLKKIQEDNEKLRETNMKLFLKVGETQKQEKEKTEEESKPKFEDLFDENGELK